MISHRLRCLSVHIPKTAGNSINRCFGIDWQDHQDIGCYQSELSPADFAAYFKFAIVRNPWDRLLSEYNYQVKKSRPDASRLHVFDERGALRPFPEWVRAALSGSAHYDPGTWGGKVSPGIHRFSPQVDWITIDGRLAVDFVARFEFLAHDFRVICRRVGLPYRRPPRRNNRFHLHYSRYYDAATRELVARYYARDVEAFGYTFENCTYGLVWPNWEARMEPPRAPISRRFVPG